MAVSYVELVVCQSCGIELEPWYAYHDEYLGVLCPNCYDHARGEEQ